MGHAATDQCLWGEWHDAPLEVLGRQRLLVSADTRTTRFPSALSLRYHPAPRHRSGTGGSRMHPNCTARLALATLCAVVAGAASGCGGSQKSGGGHDLQGAPQGMVLVPAGEFLMGRQAVPETLAAAQGDTTRP